MSELSPGAHGGRRRQHGCIDSTNARALAELEAGLARHLDLHVAESQLAGRGRRGRSWDSPAGGGLYLSLVWVPPAGAARELSPTLMTMACGLATWEAARAAGVARARLKWPNDVVVDAPRLGHEREAWEGAAKLAGILIEARSDRAGHVVGVGLNVGQRAFPAELERERAVTSLARLGLELTLAEAEALLVRHLCARLECLAADPERVAQAFLDATALRDRVVRVACSGREWSGRLRGLDARGGLQLEDAHGARRLELAHVDAVCLL